MDTLGFKILRALILASSRSQTDHVYTTQWKGAYKAFPLQTWDV